MAPTALADVWGIAESTALPFTALVVVVYFIDIVYTLHFMIMRDPFCCSEFVLD